MRAALAFCAALALGLSVSARAARLWPVPLGLDLYRPVPVDNPLTPEKIALGRQLFHDTRLSRDGSRACASCHDPAHAFGGRTPTARGVGGAAGTRNTPPIVNRAWGLSFFWDGRARTLEEQALQPIMNPTELGMTPDRVVAVARSGRYRARFRDVFGSDPTVDDVARALASYVRTIAAGDSPYDRFLMGDVSALRDDARRGLGLFSGTARCHTCHVGPLLTDEQFHNTGIAWRSGALADAGRGAVTRASADLGAFKTPTLREVARTAPYMHDGSLASLAEVIEFYDRGGHPNPGLDPRIRPLRLLPAEKRDLLAFLTSLRGRIVDGR